MSGSIAQVRLGPSAVWGWVLGAGAVLAALWLWLPAPFVALAEWERRTMGSAFPATTVLVLAGVVVLPVALARQPEIAASGEGSRLARLWRMRRFRLQAGLSAVLLVSAGVSLLPLLWTSTAVGGAHVVDLDSAPAIAPGPITLTGFRAAAGELREVRAAPGGSSAVRYLAVVPARAPAGTVGHVVAQLRDDGLAFDPQTVPTTIQGIALRNALPVAVAAELRAHGVVAAGDVMVVITDPGELTRPVWRRAAELLLAGVVLAGFAALTAWRGGRDAGPVRGQMLS